MCLSTLRGSCAGWVRLGIGLGLGFRSGQSQCVPPFRSVNYHILVKAVLYRSVNSLGVLDRLIHGLTRTVLKPSDSLVGWNVPTVRRAGKLLTDPTSSSSSILMLLRPKTLGTLSAATIASCVGANAVRFGATQLRVTGNLQEDCGHRSTN